MPSLLLVKYTGGSSATASYFRDGVLDCECQAFIGKSGVGKEREGDGRTPLGTFRVRNAFGINPDPGTVFNYIHIGPGTIACDEEGPYYNTIVDNIPCGGEKMLSLAPEYDFGLELDYNPGNVFPLGSAIFVHCKGAKSCTGGCVAIDAAMMEHILKTADETLEIKITI